MNDFTKEELEKLKELVVWDDDCIAGGNPIPIYGILVKKIQSLIDNHPKCDHRSGMSYYNEKGERVHFDTGIYRCRHCDILFRFTCENGMCVGHEDLE